jgi:ankyrin repeat protein
LIEAAKGTNKELVELLLVKGADVHAQGTFLNTALHWAAEHGQKAIVQLLIDKGATLNCENRRGLTPVDLAMDKGRKGIVELLVGRDAKITIHMAAYAGHNEKVEKFIESRIDVNSEDKKSRTPLLLACYNDNRDLVNMLLTKGAKVNASDNFGLTPLHVAAKNGYANIVELLIEKGANVNAEASDGLELYELHNEYRRSGSKPLHFAISYIDVTKLLVSNGADINAKDEGGQTSLQKAIFHGDKEVVNFLIAEGAEISIHLAAYIGSFAKVKSLIERGTDPNSRNKDGDTVLHLAVSGGHNDIAGLLIDSGANPNTKNRMGQTPLHIAAKTGYKDIAELLIDKGANVNLSNNEGRTPLLEAVYSGHKELVELLILHGADLNAKTHKDMTALDYALHLGFKDIAELLNGNDKELSLNNREPYTIIVTDPKSVRRFLRFNSTNFDDVWIPHKTDIEGLSSVLKSYLEENAPVKRLSIFEREAVMSEFRRYNREYSGFILDGAKYIICNMWLSGGFEHSVYISSTGSSKNNFTIILDGWYATIQVVFDAGSKKVVRIGYY